jgi:hypothetical protein
MIEVFKTNVQNKKECKPLIRRLKKVLPGGYINFDLEDCDKILRIDSPGFSADDIIRLLQEYGHRCEILDT